MDTLTHFQGSRVSRWHRGVSRAKMKNNNKQVARVLEMQSVHWHRYFKIRQCHCDDGFKNLKQYNTLKPRLLQAHNKPLTISLDQKPRPKPEPRYRGYIKSPAVTLSLCIYTLFEWFFRLNWTHHHILFFKQLCFYKAPVVQEPSYNSKLWISSRIYLLIFQFGNGQIIGCACATDIPFSFVIWFSWKL